MEFTYISDLTHNYMVTRPEGKGEDYVLRMALAQNIKGLIPVEARMINDELYLYYRTDSLLSLENKCMVQRPRHGELKELFHALLHVERNLTDYLMGLDNLCLTPETVFTDPTDGAWYFTCMPYSGHTGTMASFCESLLSLLDPEDSDAIADAYRICERVQEGRVRLRDLVRLFSDKEEEEEEDEPVCADPARSFRTERRMKDGMSGYMGENRDPEPERCGASSEAEEENRKPVVRPALLSLLFTVVFFADLYLRKNYILNSAGNILSLAVAAICLAGSVGALVYGRIHKEKTDDLSDAGWTNVSCDLWEDFYENGDDRYGTGSRYHESGEDAVLYDRDDDEAEDGTVVLSSSGNRRAAKLYGRNSVNNCNITLDRLPLTLGKLAGRVDLQLRDKSVSRIHAHINRDADGGIVVKDMNSTNGTFHNGIRLRPNESVRIRTGDEICFGNMVFEYL